MPTRVADPADARLAPYRELKDPARRSRAGTEPVFVVEGRLAVAQLLRSRYEVASLLVDEQQARAVAELVAAVEAAGAPAYLSPREVLAQTVGFDLHRGVVAVARRPPPADPSALCAAALGSASARGERAVIAVLEGLNDLENLGALFRNAAAFGVAAVLLDPTCADPLYRRCVRVSLGHVLSVPFARVASWPGGLQDVLASPGAVVAALAPEQGVRSVAPARTPEPLARWASRRAAAPAVAVLLGAEGHGLSARATAAAHEVVSIPMAAGVDSLNVATAAAIAFYELATRSGAAR